MDYKLNSIVIISIFLVFALLITGILTLTSYENVLAQENNGNGSKDTELGGDPELGGNTGMTESDLGGKDIGTTVSDLENDTEITNSSQTD